MKTRSWILLFALTALLCAGISLYLFSDTAGADTAYVYSDGTLVLTLDLQQDGEYPVMYGSEQNILRVENGKIAVISATCRSQDCVKRGFAGSGAPIVCLPNRLVITFSAEPTYDAMIG